MHAVVALASLAGLATLAIAQTGTPFGYGRFPCYIENADGSFTANPAACENIEFTLTQDTDGLTTQAFRPIPVGAVCQVEPRTGAYFCGIAGAACSTGAQCDGGPCVGGLCQGGLNQGCGGSDAGCSGFLTCTDDVGAVVPSGLCGDLGTFCQDPYANGELTNPDVTTEEAQLVFDQFCASGYCQLAFATCGERVSVVGGSCANDFLFGCGTTPEGQQLFPSAQDASCTCQLSAPSAITRSRNRRSLHERRSLCPASHTACGIDNGSGFECIDVSANIEQCGACASVGGVDCTQLDHVGAVGCVAGVCEIWSCEDGYTFDAAKGACSAALVL
ncbi:hypothetical protein JCM10450v2_002714 [Rhodotorula kratochvilovae]